MVNPPEKISILFCPYCGRDDQFRPFTGNSHYHLGDKCPGTPIKIVYELGEWAEETGSPPPLPAS